MSEWCGLGVCGNEARDEDGWMTEGCLASVLLPWRSKGVTFYNPLNGSVVQCPGTGQTITGVVDYYEKCGRGSLKREPSPWSEQKKRAYFFFLLVR